LNEGELQISQKEREVFTASKLKEIANIVATKVVHPISNRPFPITDIEEAIKVVAFKAKMDEDSKKQASGCIKLIQKRFKIKRANMKVRVSIGSHFKDVVKSQLEPYFQSHETFEIEEDSIITITAIIGPQVYRDLSNRLQENFGGAVLEIIEHAIVNNDVTDIGTVGLLEERSDYEENDGDEVKQGNGPAERELEELGIDRDLKVAGAIQPAKKKRKKKNKKRRNKKMEQFGDEFEEKEGLGFGGGEYPQEVGLGVQEIQAVQKTKKKKKKKNRRAYNIGSDEVQKKRCVEKTEDHVFERVSDEELKALVENFKYKCSSCPFGTDDNPAYKAHFKSDWHRFNSSRKAGDEFAVTEDQFNEYKILQEFI